MLKLIETGGLESLLEHVILSSGCSACGLVMGGIPVQGEGSLH